MKKEDERLYDEALREIDSLNERLAKKTVDLEFSDATVTQLLAVGEAFRVEVAELKAQLRDCEDNRIDREVLRELQIAKMEAAFRVR